MSATLNAALFADYFKDFDTEVIDIPGRTFPVERMYLEDAIEICGYELDTSSDYSRNGGSGGGRGGGGQKGKSGKGRNGGGGSNGPPTGPGAQFGESAQWWVDQMGSAGALQNALNKGGQQQAVTGGGKNSKNNGGNKKKNNNKRTYSTRTVENIQNMDLTTINNDLVADLVAHVAVNGKNAGVYGASAILVFLPGLAEITDCLAALRAHPILSDFEKYRILPLHSQLPTQEQRAVFIVPPKGTTKIVLSTNIAETSVTINDISVVIDAGTHKEMQYDPSVGMSCLREVRVSKANALQRAGRAGRVREGFTYHLFLRHEETEMPSKFIKYVSLFSPLFLRNTSKQRPPPPLFYMLYK
jgi:HrpA-like RNA helicase